MTHFIPVRSEPIKRQTEGSRVAFENESFLYGQCGLFDTQLSEPIQPTMSKFNCIRALC